MVRSATLDGTVELVEGEKIFDLAAEEDSSEMGSNVLQVQHLSRAVSLYRGEPFDGKSAVATDVVVEALLGKHLVPPAGAAGSDEGVHPSVILEALRSKAKEELVNIQSLLVLAENMKLCKVSKIRAMQEEAVALSKIIYGLLRHLRKPKADKEEAAAA